MKDKRIDDYGTIDIDEDNVFINRRSSNYQSFQVPSSPASMQPIILPDIEPAQGSKAESWFLSLILDNKGSTARDHLGKYFNANYGF